MDKFDVVIIGSGPGGYVAAIRAGQLGLKTAIIEKDKELGGTCLNIGCIPSKALLTSSDHFSFAKKEAAKHGIVIENPRVDLPTMQKRKDKVVKTLTGGVRQLMKTNKVMVLEGMGTITAPGKVSVKSSSGETQEIETKNIVIATGSVPIELPFAKFDGQRIVSSTEALCFTEAPKKFLVIGAGAIGLELGSVWMRLGAEVTVLEFMDRIVPGMDRKSGALLQRILEKQGMRFRLSTSARAARVEGSEVVVTVAPSDGGGGASEERCDVLLVAVGRRPYTEGLGAAEAGVTLDEKGRVMVDEHYQTVVPGIYAIGDVIAGPMLAHKAEEEGIAAVERMAGLPGHVAYECVPNVVYTWPELASVGMTEEEAAQRGIEVAIGTFPFLANGRAKAMGEKDGQVKILADAKTDRILGAHILGPRASDLIAELATAMELSASAEDVARSVHAHPTLPEAVKEAALAVAKRAIHI